MVEFQSHIYVNTLFHTDNEQFFFHLHGEQQIHVCSNSARWYYIISYIISYHIISYHVYDMAWHN